MQLAGRLADEVVEARLHVHVKVFQLLPPREKPVLYLLADGVEARADAIGFVSWR